MNDFICLTVRQTRTIKNDQKGFKDNEEKSCNSIYDGSTWKQSGIYQAVMAADTTAKTETSENADKDSTESKDKDVAEDADKADEEKEDLKTIGEKPEEDTEGVFSVKLKNLTGKVITGVTVKNEKDEEYPDNFLKEEDKFEADEERVLWFDPSAKDKADEENKDSSNDTKETTDN